ncbi:N-acetylmuramoyl-L-alanine amidase [Richelia intracellularis]|nr:N-acetylmuramoyl-L-alanine amidase [Richelia intracellularis]
MDIVDANISSSFTSRNIQVNKHGVKSIQVDQLKISPSVVRMTLQVDKNSPDWRANSSGVGGLVILPTRRVTNSARSNRSDIVISTEPVQNTSRPKPIVRNAVSTITSVELAGNSSQLLIRGDRTLSANGGWDRRTALFRIEIPNAKLSENVKGPKLNASSPVLRLRLQQQDSNTVVIFVQPASGVRIGSLSKVGQLLSLPMRRHSNRMTTNTNPSIGLPPLTLPNPSSVATPVTPRPVTQPRPSRKGRLLVMIDPGHGGRDPGAVGIGGLQEKQVIMPISLRVADILRQNGVQVVMTRKSDYFVTLPGRVKMAEQANADYFVSIHANSAGMNRPEVSGFETFYFNTGKGLAQAVHRRVIRTIKMRDRRVRRARFYVLRKTSMPSILVETGFLTGREDAKNLRSEWFQNKMAEAIAKGILDYIK